MNRKQKRQALSIIEDGYVWAGETPLVLANKIAAVTNIAYSEALQFVGKTIRSFHVKGYDKTF